MAQKRKMRALTPNFIPDQKCPNTFAKVCWWSGRWMGGEVAQGEVGLQVSAGGVLGDPCQAEGQNFN